VSSAASVRASAGVQTLSASQCLPIKRRAIRYSTTHDWYRENVDEQPDDETFAAFEVLGGTLKWEETARLLGYRDTTALNRALLALPPRQRQAVALVKYTGLPERQAAAVMRISGGALAAHLARGLRALRQG
jgi:DNA-directed RNA polymerase specialized sigma24 family protein